jgi:hypothetical protein
LRSNPKGNARRVTQLPGFLDRWCCDGVRYKIAFLETARQFVYAAKMQREGRNEDEKLTPATGSTSVPVWPFRSTTAPKLACQFMFGWSVNLMFSNASGLGRKDDLLVKPNFLTVVPLVAPAACTTLNSFSSSVLKLKPAVSATRE